MITKEAAVVPAPAAQMAQTDFEKWSKLPEEERDAAPAAEPARPAAAAAEPEPAVAADPDAEPADPEVPKGLQKRFRELTTKIRNLEGEVAAGKAKPAEPVKVEPAAAAPTGMPKEEDFDSYAKFVIATAEWAVGQAALKKVHKDQRESAEAADRARGIAWQGELKSARERHADYDAVALSEMPINQATHNAIVEGGVDGAELAYYLGHHKDEAAEIFKLPPVATTLALGKIMAKFEAGAAPVRPAVSRAPKPPQLVAGAADSSIGKEPDPADFPKWQAWNRKREALEAAD